jgi:poly(U)-specific endoribonuclease
MALYDNYAAAVETPEQVTNQELAEENAYLDAIMRTNVMRTAHRFLAQKGNVQSSKVAQSLNTSWLGLADNNTDRFKQIIKNLWFGMYSRAPGAQGSSGFEHVFLGEQKNGISGLHSWLRYNQEEASGNMEYLGFIKTVNVGRVGFPFTKKNWIT